MFTTTYQFITLRIFSGKLIIPVTQSGCNIEIWERCDSDADPNLIFGESEEFWDYFALQMSNDSTRVQTSAGYERLDFKFRFKIEAL